jgi:acetamidase/formamidase
LLKGRFGNRLFKWKIGKEFAEPLGGFLRGVKIPVDPFLGVIATAPSSGEYGMIPPQYFGGNMDNKLLRRGARLRLPVNVDGALLSFGDPHACQGDGEVCGTAIETTASVKVGVRIIHGENQLRAPLAHSKEKFEQDVLVSMGIDPDLRKAAIMAVDSMIDELKKIGYNEEESYVLCSVAGNLRISEIVDEPNLVVSMVIPRGIFK